MRLFDLDVRHMTIRLASYRKATEKIITANPNPKVSREYFDREFDLLVQSLRDPECKW